ncbi:hypothetical protein HDV03_004938 [Kappamyces sp. JEL0829]|nr:hypothetical protein HDV03_004938 [Kappamyces sp. JEL0829]
MSRTASDSSTRRSLSKAVANKVMLATSRIMVEAANDITVSWQRVQDSIHASVPGVVQELESLHRLEGTLGLAIQDMAEVQEKIREMDRIDSFTVAIEQLQACIAHTTRTS